MSDHLDTVLLKEAYSHGIFPFPQDDSGIIPWVSLDPRGILAFENLRIPRSTEKALRGSAFNCTLNQDFQSVIRHCKRVKRPDQSDTWITAPLEKSYLDLHQEGNAASVEVWEEGSLIGGLYGVWIKGVFSGESMFHLKANASKAALVFLCFVLKMNRVRWVDTQMVTPVLESFGGIEIPRTDYFSLLRSSQRSAKKLSLPGHWTYLKDGEFIQGASKTR